MAAEHQRYEELAVGHVLGGLDPADAASFRAHLISCRDCRLRVAELRDIAAGLQVAEREERAHARLRTKVDEDQPEEEAGGAASLPRQRSRPSTVVVFLVLVGLLALVLFWNLHLRTRDAALGALADGRAETLQELAVGVPVPVTTAEGVDAIVVVDDQDVAFSVTGLPEPAAGERLVVWLLDGPDGDRPVMQRLTTSDQPGSLSGTVETRGEQDLAVTIEAGRPGPIPQGAELVRATVNQRAQ